MTTLEASLSFQSENLWSYVIKLIRLRWVIFINGFKRARPVRKFLTLFLLLLVLGVSIGSYLLTTSLLRMLDSPVVKESGINSEAFMNTMPALIVSAAFLLILITSFRLLLQALYLANDMDFLLTAPIPVRAVFVTKLLEAILPNFILIIAFGLPILFGIGVAGEYDSLYFPLVLVVLASLSLAAAAIASLLVMAVVRIIPAKRVAEILALLGAAFFMVIAQWNNLRGTEYGPLSADQISKGTQISSTFNSAWSPLAWGGRGLVDLGEGRWLSGIFYLTAILAISGGLFWLALHTAERLYITGWSSLRVVSQPKKITRTHKQRALSAARLNIIRRLLPSSIQAIMLKDIHMLRRDLRNLSQVIGVLIMGIVFAVMLLRSGGGEPAAGEGEAPALFMDLLRSGMGYGSMVIAMFVGWGLISNLALITFSMEGRSYWLIKTSPVSAGKQLVAKFLVVYLPTLSLGWFFLLIIAILQRVPPTAILYGLPSIALILAGLGGINMAFGVSNANLNWTDPRQMTGGVTGILSVIVSIVYQLATILLFFGAPIGLPLLGISAQTGEWIGLLVGGTVALLCTILPLVRVKDRIYWIGEE